MVTVGILLLLGWQLNILESVVITLAIGLRLVIKYFHHHCHWAQVYHPSSPHNYQYASPSVDFTLHYGIMYKLSGETSRERAVTFSIATMASPVIREQCSGSLSSHFCDIII